MGHDCSGFLHNFFIYPRVKTGQRMTMNAEGEYLPHEPPEDFPVTPVTQQVAGSSTVEDVSPTKSDISISELIGDLGSPDQIAIEALTTLHKVTPACGILEVVDVSRPFFQRGRFPGGDTLSHPHHIKPMVRMHRAVCETAGGRRLHHGTGKASADIIMISMINAHHNDIPDAESLIEAVQLMRAEEDEQLAGRKETAYSLNRDRKEKRYKEILDYNFKS